MLVFCYDFCIYIHKRYWSVAFLWYLYWVLISWYLLLFSCSVVSDSLWPHGLQHTRLPCPWQSLRACSNLVSKETATHSSILAWKISWIEELGVIWGYKKLDMTEWLKNKSNNKLELNIPENLPAIFVPVKKCIFSIIKSNTCIIYLLRTGTSFCPHKLTLNKTEENG